MKLKSILLFLIILSSATIYTQPKQQISFSEDFKSYQRGSDGSPTWHPAKGNWQIIDGKYIQQSNEYDCASMLDFNLTGSFKLESEFEQLDGDLGVGFIFSSYGRESIEFSQIVRFDGNGVFLVGYFQNGEFNASTSVKALYIQPKTKHTLTLEVNRERESYSCYLDGKELKKDIPLIYPSGYCGLQSSAGSVRFHYVKLASLNDKAIMTEVDWVRRFAIDQTGLIYIPDERKGIIKVINDEGVILKTIGTPAKEKGQLHKPNAICFLNESSFVVTDRGKHKLHQFSNDGRWINSIGWRGKSIGQFDEPVAIAVNSSNQIFVLEKNNNRVQVLDDSLRAITQFGNEKLKEPLDLTIQDINIYVVNTGLSQIEWYRWNGKRATWYKSISYGGGEVRGIASYGYRIYLSLVNEVRAYDTSGILLNKFIGRSINFILPQGLTFDRHGDLYIADFFYGRIIKTTSNLLDPQPIVGFNTPNEATLRWNSYTKEKGTLILKQNDVSIDTISEEKITDEHVINIKNLKSSTTYRLKFRPTVQIIPPTKSYSRSYTFTTSSTEPAKQYARLPIATLIFTNIVDDSKTFSGIPPPIPSTEIERIKSQIADGIRFYWIHSGMRLFLDNETIIINEQLKRSQVYGSEWWYPPLDSILEKYLRLNSKDVKDYSGFIYLTCTQEYDTTLNKYMLAGRGGGFTNGVGTGKGYGISWWDVTKANHNAGNNWLMVHEFNHQLDDIFFASGHPEYWFNHISPTIGTAAKFGEHFDANSFIMQMVPFEEWYDLRYTSIEKARDTDQDGIPDNDSRLPLDEDRLGSDSLKVDTDDDGINDFNELFFSNWLVEGWGETYGGNAIFPNLNHLDADSDGISDKEDLYPCFPYSPNIFFTNNGTLLNQFAILEDDKIKATVYSGWNNDSLYFTFQMNKLVPIKLMIDGDADGWFLGRENYLINISVENDSTITGKVQIFNATDPHEWPHMDQILGEQIGLTSKLLVKENVYQVTLAIPRNNSTGLNLIENKNIALSLGFQCQFDQDGTKRYINIFEPNRFIDVQLKK